MGSTPSNAPKTKPKTSERWKNIRGTVEELKDLNDVCRGLEIETFERERVLRKVSQKEVLRMLLDTELAKRYRDLARSQKTRGAL